MKSQAILPGPKRTWPETFKVNRIRTEKKLASTRPGPNHGSRRVRVKSGNPTQCRTLDAFSIFPKEKRKRDEHQWRDGLQKCETVPCMRALQTKIFPVRVANNSKATFQKCITPVKLTAHDQRQRDFSKFSHLNRAITKITVNLVEGNS